MSNPGQISSWHHLLPGDRPHGSAVVPVGRRTAGADFVQNQSPVEKPTVKPALSGAKE